jgi:hypothetical protein
VGLMTVGAAIPGALLLVLAVALAVRARHWLSLATRSGVGARSEEVRRVLAISPAWAGVFTIPSRGRAQGTSTRW